MAIRTKVVAGPNGSQTIELTEEENAARDAEEKAWADGADARTMVEIRGTRDALLTATDWWGASDNTMSDAQTAYRLALRNYPATYTADNTAAWPTKP